MAHHQNPSKFTSPGLNLNPRYGQQQQPPPPSSAAAVAGRRPSAGGGMVILGRHRGTSLVGSKPPAKLSVPPPLNLPSLRRENARIDSSAAAAGGKIAASTAASSSVPKWKPPPQPPVVAEKAVVLKGEDFPSLRAAVAPQAPPQMLPVSEAPKERLQSPKVKFSPPVPKANASLSQREGPAAEALPIPVVPIGHHSDWADDERDTGLSIPVREKSDSFSRDGVNDGSWRSRWGEMQPRLDLDKYYSTGGGSGQMPYRNSPNTDSWGSKEYPPVSRNGDMFRGVRADERPKENGWQKGTQFQNSSLGNLGRENRFAPPTVAKPIFLEDPSLHSIADVNVKVFKKKKDVGKSGDYYDPARESFEAELERISQVQEQEKKRAMEEHARVQEIARKEEENRERIRKEEEERQRRIEEEAREAVKQVEQEKLEAARKAEDQRIAWEEEKRRIKMEEDRRKEAAKQKLLELEARIARRRAESGEGDDKVPSSVDEPKPSALKSDNISTDSKFIEKEDGQRSVERITSSGSSEACSLKYSDSAVRPYNSREGKPSSSGVAYYGIRGPYPEQDIVRQNPKLDILAARRGSNKREFDDGSKFSLPFAGGGVPVESPWTSDDFPHGKASSHWEMPRKRGYFDHTEFEGDMLHRDSSGEGGWLQRSSYGSLHAPPVENFFDSSDPNSFSSFSKSRYPMRQPRVLPPPPPVTQRGSFGAPAQQGVSSSEFINSDVWHNETRSNMSILPTPMRSSYKTVHQSMPAKQGASTLFDRNDKQVEQTLAEDSSHLHGFLSSHSVSSSHSSLAHMSLDEMDVNGDSTVLPNSADGEAGQSSDNDYGISAVEVVDSSRVATSSTISRAEESAMDIMDSSRLATSSTISHVEDDWHSGNNEEDLRQQDEYDEAGNIYNEELNEGDMYEEDELKEADGSQDDELNEDELIDLNENSEESLSEKQDAHRDGQIILGFNEGVPIQIPCESEVQSQITQSIENNIPARENHSMFDATYNPETVPKYGAQEFSSNAVSDEEVKSETDLATEQSVYSHIVEASCLPGPSVEEMEVMMSATPVTSSSLAPGMSTSSGIVQQRESLVNVNFGLFSGTPLIPPPISSIQIGSIQMPIPLNTQICPSFTQLHASPAPLFQFGQLRYTPSFGQNMTSSPAQPRYTPPVAQNVSSLHAQSSTSLQPPLPSLQRHEQSHLDVPSSRTSSVVSHNKSSGKVSEPPVTCSVQPPERLNTYQTNVLASNHRETIVNHIQAELMSASENTAPHVARDRQQKDYVHSVKSMQRASSNKGFTTQFPNGNHFIRLTRDGKFSNAPMDPRAVTNNRRRRHVYVPKDSVSRHFISGAEGIQRDHRGFQRKNRRNMRREFRVRENVGVRQLEVMGGAVNFEQSDKPDGFSKFSGSENQCSNSFASTSLAEGSIVQEKAVVKETMRTYETSYSRKPHSVLPNDPEHPRAQIAAVSMQHGVSVPIDEDGFIEVRSRKRLMNVKRELRSQEKKSLMGLAKVSRRQPMDSPIHTNNSEPHRKTPVFGGRGTKKVFPDAQITNKIPVGPTDRSSDSTMSKSLQAAGPPLITTESCSIHPLENPPHNAEDLDPVASADGSKPFSGLMPEKNSIAPSVPDASHSWESSSTQQVIALTQTQLEEAMKSQSSHEANNSSFFLEHNTSGASEEIKKTFPSGSPVNSLLAGEKIQFGAVTSQTVLPAVARASFCPSGAPLPDNGNASGNDSTSMFCGVDRQKVEVSSSLADAKADAEAEAAASAVAVAAITNDDSVIPSIDPIAVSARNTENFNAADVNVLNSGGGSSSRDISLQSSTEESLTVALPADLSVDTPAVPFWPPPSPQASGPILSQFPGLQPSHFAFDMNPAQIFAYGTNNETAGTQGHLQNSNPAPSGQLGAWPQLHSGVDCFYRPGFPAPFIGPGGIPGVHGPAHMVVYNHFPVGQFGQLGLGFMGSPYIPSDKQPDWKQSHLLPVNQGELIGPNAASGQSNSPTVPAPVQHMHPPSSLMPMASPFTMFDISPFQPSADMSMQACWPHLAAPPLHSVSVPVSMPVQQHPADGAIAIVPQTSNNLPPNNSRSSGRYHEPPTVPSISNRSFATTIDSNRSLTSAKSSQLPDELGLVDQPSSSCSSDQIAPLGYSQMSGKNNKTPMLYQATGRAAPNFTNGSNSSGAANQTVNGVQPGSSLPSQQFAHPVQHSVHSAGGGNPDRWGRHSHNRVMNGLEWQQRSFGFQGRNQSFGGDNRNFNRGRTKQIYVAKSSNAGPAPSKEATSYS